MKIYALIGPTGTGKSFRAPHIAQELGVDCIIDDGLLISQGRIIAGRSAKAEVSKIRAAKIAIFYFSDHREELKKALQELKPQKIMLLGTSFSMVERICERLEIPSPSKVIYIEDIASADEISLATQARINEGKHTIPVPLVELKRNPWNTIVDAIPVMIWRWFYSPPDRTVVRPPFSYLGKLVITEEALRSLVWIILTRLPFIEKVTEINLGKTDSGVWIQVGCVFRSDRPLTQLGQITRRVLSEKIEYLAGVQLTKLDVDIEGLVEEKSLLFSSVSSDFVS